MYPYIIRSRGARYLLAIGFLLLVSLIVSWPTISAQKLPLSTAYLVSTNNPWKSEHFYPVKNSIPDVIGQLVPWKIFTIQELKAGRLPLWNPHQFSGTPHLANYQSAVFFPLNVLFFIFSFPAAWSILVLLQPLLAMILMFALLNHQKFSLLASVIGGLAFGLGGFMTTWMAYGTIGYGLLVLPLGLLAVEKLLDQQRRRWFWVVASVVALSFLAGHFQTSLYLVFVLTVYVFTKSGLSLRTKLAAFLAILIGTGLAGGQLVPSIDLYLASQRASQFEPAAFREGLISPLYLLTLLAPDYFGNPVTRNDYFGRYAEWQGFAGSLVLALSLFGLNSKDNRKWLYLGIIFLVLLLSLRTAIPQFLVFLKIPVLGTGNSNRAIALAPLALAGLAATGLDQLRKHWPTRLTEWGPALALVLWLSLMVLFPLSGFFPGEAVSRRVAWRNLVLPGVLTLSFLVILYLGRYQQLRLVLLSCLLGLVSFGLWRYHHKWSPFGPNEWFYPSHPSLSYLRHAQKDQPWRYLGSFGQAASTPFGLYALDGYDPVNLGAYNQFVASIEDGLGQSPNPAGESFPKAGRFTRPALDLIGVRYLVYSQGELAERPPWIFPVWDYPDEFGLVWEGKSYQIWQNLTVMPRAAVFAKTRADGPVTELFNNGSFRQELMVAEAGEGEPPEPSLVVSEAELVSFGPGEMIVKTPDLSGYLFVANAYQSGWRATVDDKPAPMIRANRVFQAIPVKGQRVVRIWYQPQSLKLGMAISFFSLLAGGLLFELVRTRPELDLKIDG